MTANARAPYRADHVGSLLRPARLHAARDQKQRDEISAEQLRAIEDECIREVVRLQEDLGYQGVTDGEFRRAWWHLDFLQQIENVEVTAPRVKARFHTDEGDLEVLAPGLRVAGKLRYARPIMVDHFEFLKSVARHNPKFTIPSPSTVHFRGGRAAIDQKAYPDLAEFYDDLGDVYAQAIAAFGKAGCRYLQIDEVNLAYLCDPKLRDQARGIGEDPDRLPHTYAKLINAAIAGRPKDMVVCMHLCRGNLESAWAAEGGYDPVAEVLFNEIDVDGYFLEYDSPRAGDFSPLRFVPKNKRIVLGLVTTKTPVLESGGELKQRIDEASKYVPLDQLALSPQCGFSSTAAGNKVTVDDQIAKLRLIQDVARDVWH